MEPVVERAKKEAVKSRYTEEQIKGFSQKAPSEWPALNETETRIMLRLLSSSGKIERSSASKVEYDELFQVWKARAKDGDKRAAKKLATFAQFQSDVVEELPDNMHYANVRIGRQGQGFLFIAENWRKQEAVGDEPAKNKMVPFTEFGGRKVPTLK